MTFYKVSLGSYVLYTHHTHIQPGITEGKNIFFSIPRLALSRSSVNCCCGAIGKRQEVKPNWALQLMLLKGSKAPALPHHPSQLSPVVCPVHFTRDPTCVLVRAWGQEGSPDPLVRLRRARDCSDSCSEKQAQQEHLREIRRNLSWEWTTDTSLRDCSATGYSQVCSPLPKNRPVQK